MGQDLKRKEASYHYGRGLQWWAFSVMGIISVRRVKVGMAPVAGSGLLG